jgi:uncharacterized protein (DUF3084 family)
MKFLLNFINSVHSGLDNLTEQNKIINDKIDSLLNKDDSLKYYQKGKNFTHLTNKVFTLNKENQKLNEEISLLRNENKILKEKEITLKKSESELRALRNEIEEFKKGIKPYKEEIRIGGLLNQNRNLDEFFKKEKDIEASFHSYNRASSSPIRNDRK